MWIDQLEGSHTILQRGRVSFRHDRWTFKYSKKTTIFTHELIVVSFYNLTLGPRLEKNKKGVDQTAQLRSLVNAFVIHYI